MRVPGSVILALALLAGAGNAGTLLSGPQVMVAEFGLEQAINRAGSPAALVCRLEQAAGRPAPRQVRVRLELPAGVTLVKGSRETTIALLARQQVLRWQVRAARPLRAAATLRVSAQGRELGTVAAKLDFTAPVKVAPARWHGKPWVPLPKPAKTDYLVGAYYFPGWRQGVHFGWRAIEPFPERKPVLGWYQEGAPGVADWHIKWALEHGISFFAYDWYWDRGARSLEHALHEGFFDAAYQRQLKFCLLWANHNPPGSASEEDLLAVTRYWLDHYFLRPNYLRIDGKPVVIIFAPSRILHDLGPEGSRAAIAKMRELCRAAGLPGLYLAACTAPQPGEVKAFAPMGFDALTGYNYADAGADPAAGLHHPYETAPEGYRAIWEQLASYGLTETIPVTDPGWDCRPWQGERAMVRTGKNPATFRRMLEYAKAFADRHPVGQEKAKMVLVEAWNEFGEGAAIEPERQFGFGWLDAIRSVFAPAAGPHHDVVPQDVGLAVPQWTPVLGRLAWEFDRPGEGQGWGPFMGLRDFTITGGVMRAVTVTGDAAFGASVDLAAADCPRARIRMRLDKGEMAQLFWVGTTSPESEANSIRFKTIPDGQFHTYTLALAELPAWRGNIIRLRLDPNSDEGATVEVDWIRLGR